MKIIMQRVITKRFFTGLFALLMLCVSLPALVQAAPAPVSDVRALPSLDESASVADLNDQLDLIRQKVTVSANDDLLSCPRQAALQVPKQPAFCRRSPQRLAVHRPRSAA